MERCAEQCNQERGCCDIVCTFLITNLITINEAGEGSVKLEGYITAFMLSVGNDSMWLPVITSSTHKCIDQFGGSDEFVCEGFVEVLCVMTFLLIRLYFSYSKSFL